MRSIEVYVVKGFQRHENVQSVPLKMVSVKWMVCRINVLMFNVNGRRGGRASKRVHCVWWGECNSVKWGPNTNIYIVRT